MSLNIEKITIEDPDAVLTTNDHQELTYTNYFETKQSKAGVIYMTCNAHCCRLLVPETQAAVVLKEIKTAEYVIITEGFLGGKNAFEILFEDNTDMPYSIHILAFACDRYFETRKSYRFQFAIYTAAGKQAEFEGRYRKVLHLPCLLPWAE